MDADAQALNVMQDWRATAPDPFQVGLAAWDELHTRIAAALRRAHEAGRAEAIDECKPCIFELYNLEAMVLGECPSLLEDHHSAVNIRAAIEKGEAAIRALKEAPRG